MNDKLYDVVAVNLKTNKVRIIDTNQTHANADAVVKMAIMRRGLDEEFYSEVIHGDLVMYLMNTFTQAKMLNAFLREGEPLPSVVLYGEGYGAGIQRGRPPLMWTRDETFTPTYFIP